MEKKLREGKVAKVERSRASQVTFDLAVVILAERKEKREMG